MSAEIILFPLMAQPRNRLRYWRELKGMSQQTLADAVGCSKMQVSRFERGVQGMDIGWLHLFANELEVAPADILDVKDNPAAAHDDGERAWLAMYRSAAPEVRDQLVKVGEALTGYSVPKQQDVGNSEAA